MFNVKKTAADPNLKFVPLKKKHEHDEKNEALAKEIAENYKKKYMKPKPTV
jgi:hypothetical protein